MSSADSADTGTELTSSSKASDAIVDHYQKTYELTMRCGSNAIAPF